MFTYIYIHVYTHTRRRDGDVPFRILFLVSSSWIQSLRHRTHVAVFDLSQTGHIQTHRLENFLDPLPLCRCVRRTPGQSPHITAPGVTGSVRRHYFLTGVHHSQVRVVCVKDPKVEVQELVSEGIVERLSELGRDL